MIVKFQVHTIFLSIEREAKSAEIEIILDVYPVTVTKYTLSLLGVKMNETNYIKNVYTKTSSAINCIIKLLMYLNNNLCCSLMGTIIIIVL